MKAPIAILRAYDEAATRGFYLDFLGFEVVFEHRFDPAAPLYMGVRQGNCEVHLSQHFGDGTPGTYIRIEVPDVQSYAKELNAKRYRNARPGVQHQDWGWDEMSIADPAGNKLIFCTAQGV